MNRLREPDRRHTRMTDALGQCEMGCGNPATGEVTIERRRQLTGELRRSRHRWCDACAAALTTDCGADGCEQTRITVLRIVHTGADGDEHETAVGFCATHADAFEQSRTVVV